MLSHQQPRTLGMHVSLRQAEGVAGRCRGCRALVFAGGLSGFAFPAATYRYHMRHRQSRGSRIRRHYSSSLQGRFPLLPCQHLAPRSYSANAREGRERGRERRGPRGTQLARQQWAPMIAVAAAGHCCMCFRCSCFQETTLGPAKREWLMGLYRFVSSSPPSPFPSGPPPRGEGRP